MERLTGRRLCLLESKLPLSGLAREATYRVADEAASECADATAFSMKNSPLLIVSCFLLLWSRSSCSPPVFYTQCLELQGLAAEGILWEKRCYYFSCDLFGQNAGAVIEKRCRYALRKAQRK